jgi:CheY-like chemotaxis protein
MSSNYHTILHVEDDANDVLLLKRAAEKASLPVNLITVSDGDLAISYLSAERVYADRHRFPLPELVLLDLKLPRRSGIEVLQWMRQVPEIRRIPVVILTSSHHNLDIEQAYDAGANSYLVKPVGFDALMEIVRRIDGYWFGLNQTPTP